jgi:hypothetical protein
LCQTHLEKVSTTSEAGSDIGSSTVVTTSERPPEIIKDEEKMTAPVV